MGKKKPKHKRKHLTDAELAFLAENYPDTPNEELAKAINVSLYTIRARATRHGWRKSSEYISKVCREKAISADSQSWLNSPEANRKKGEVMKKRWESERMRIRWGLEQKTRHHVRVEPREKLLQRNRLQRLGYIVDEKTLTAYYTPRTHRATRIEAVPRGTTKGNIHSYYDFRPYDGKLD